MKRFQSLFLVGAITLCGIASWAQTGPSLSPAGDSEIDSIVKRAVEQRTVPGVVVAIANKDRVLYYKSFGLMDVAKQKPMTKPWDTASPRSSCASCVPFASTGKPVPAGIVSKGARAFQTALHRREPAFRSAHRPDRR